MAGASVGVPAKMSGAISNESNSLIRKLLCANQCSQMSVGEGHRNANAFWGRVIEFYDEVMRGSLKIGYNICKTKWKPPYVL